MDPVLHSDKLELPEEFFFFFYNSGSEKVHKIGTALVLRLQLFVVVFVFFCF